jgi:putative spermidine/putrescine transport system ATP-binding protein
VAAVEYQGSQVKLRLEADGIDDLTVVLSDKEFYADPVAAGDTVAVAWNDDDAHVMA